MEHWHWRRRLGYGTLQAVGLGFLAAALEIVTLTAGLRLPLSIVDVVVLGVLDMLLLGLVAAGVAAVVGVAHPALASQRTSGAVAAQLGVTGALLAALLLARVAAWVLSEGEPVAAAAALGVAVGFGGVVHVNARYWLRRAELDRAPRAPWLAVAGGVALVVIAAAAVGHSRRATGGERALADDRNAVLVTVDGMRHDDVPASVRAIGDEGVAFLDAVTPSPHAGPAHATLLTGVHPVRHGVLVDGDRLPRGHRTLAEVLAEEGYATAGFVSHGAVGADAGFEQGFRVFDDDFSPIAGLHRLGLVRLLPSQAGRAPMQTVDRFLPWLRRHSDRPFLAWVHLSGDTAAIDAAVRAIREAIEDEGVLDETLLVVAGAHGLMRGEHGLRGDVGLYDPAVRVPLVLRAPGVEVAVPRVAPQVRTMDVSATVLDWLGLDPLGASEGLSLVQYATGERRATIWCALVGLDAGGRLHLGMRNNGVKYIRDPDGGELLFDLREDPQEERSVVESQPQALEAARQLMAGDVAALDALLRARRGSR